LNNQNIQNKNQELEQLLAYQNFYNQNLLNQNLNQTSQINPFYSLSPNLMNMQIPTLNGINQLTGMGYFAGNNLNPESQFDPNNLNMLQNYLLQNSLNQVYPKSITNNYNIVNDNIFTAKSRNELVNLLIQAQMTTDMNLFQNSNNQIIIKNDENQKNLDSEPRAEGS
jgi:hypothetical protein